MWKPAVAALLTVLACPVVFTSLEAGVFCGHPLGICPCSPCLTCQPHPCGCSVSPQAGCRTQVPSAQPITYRDVTRTEYRLQPETRQVPVTRYRNVTVDQGAWHRIWVPKIVTEQIPETVYENHTSYRQVPYQVTQRVPEATSIPGSRRMTSLSGLPATAGGHTCPSVINWSSQPDVTTQSPGPLTAAVDPAHADLRPLRRISVRPNRLTPVPEPPAGPQTDAGGWTRVETRNSHTRPAPHRTGSAAGRFIPAPRAASVLRTRSPRLR